MASSDINSNILLFTHLPIRPGARRDACDINDCPLPGSDGMVRLLSNSQLNGSRGPLFGK
jgi:hypothetical protein